LRLRRTPSLAFWLLFGFRGSIFFALHTLSYWQRRMTGLSWART
jgi:hypothetical protein